MTYAYNTQVHPSIRVAPFDLVLLRPPGPLLLKRELSVHDAQDPRAVKDQFTQAVRRLIDMSAESLKESQQRYKKNFDKRPFVLENGYTCDMNKKQTKVPELKEGMNSCPGDWVHMR